MSKPHSPQTQAADPSLSVFVTANAGSGKTSTLVSRVARLLLRGVDPAAILCMTYTKAAAAEMQRRLYQRLGGWSVLPDHELQEQLAKLEESEPQRFDAAMLSRARALFARALETPGGLKIQTIHAFCEKLLRRFPLEAGVSPRFKVLEDAVAAEVSREARDDVARLALAAPDGPVGRAYAHFAVELDGGAFESLFAAIETRRSAFRAWFDASGGPAGAVARIWAACDLDPTEPEAVEAEAFEAVDWAAWRRVTDALAEGSSSDQKCADKMRAIAEAAEAGVFDFDKLCDVVCTKGKRRERLATKSVAPWAKDWLVSEQTRICALLDKLRAARVGRDSTYVAVLAYAYLEQYAAAKAASAGLDFSDLIERTRDLLVERSDAAWVLFKLDGGIDHVLVDEAQDTAPEQWDIVRALTAEFFAGEGTERDERLLARSIFAVGDEKQSIYSFQGARPERLAQELQAYQEIVRGSGGAFEPVPLLKSWRSTPEVLRFVDATFAAPENARALSPLNAEPPLHVAARHDQAGCVELWPLFQDQPVDKPEAWDAPVDAEPVESARKRLARRMAEEIAGLIARGETVWSVDKEGRPVRRPAHAGDVLILVRRRDALFEEILRALKQKGVPVAGADRLKLSSHIAFDDLIGLGRFVLFPNDDLTLAALLRSPFCDVDEASLFDLAWNRKGGLWRALRERAGERPEWGAAHELLAWARREAEARTPFDFYSRWLNRLDAEGRSMRARVLARLGREAEEAVDEFLAQVLNAEQRGPAALETVVAALEQAEVEVKREMEGAHREVRVMTVHGAKGLEAPIVFLPDTTVKATAQGAPLFLTAEGDFLWAPRKDDDCQASADARALRDDRIDDESRRLLYVALTRARDRIVVCGRVAAKRSPAEGSWWELCSQAFDAVEARTVALDGGQEITRFGEDPVTAEAEAARATVAHALPGWAGRAAEPEALPRWASPSALVEDVGRAPAPSPLSARGGLGRFRRGELIHKLFQILPDLPVAARADAAARLLGREPGLDDAQRAEMAAAAFAVLDDPKFAAVFGPGSRAEVALAGGAPELKPGLAVAGRLDRLVVTPERVLVIDYKTNRPAPDRAEDADEAYLAQMAAYVAVLRTVYPGRAVEAALVWTDGAKLTPLSPELIEATLVRLRCS